MIKAGSPRFVALIVLLAAILLGASGCFSPYTGEAGEGGNLVIQLGEAGTSRAVSLTPETKNQLVHTITVSGGPGIPQVKTGITLGQRVAFTVVPGTWDVSVKGYLGDVLRAEDTLETGVEVSTGRADVSITMQAYAPGLYQKNADGGYTTGFDSPLDTTLDVAVTLVGDSPGYDFVMLVDEDTATVNYTLNSPGSTLTLQGYDKGHTLVWSNFGSMFIIDENTKLILDNITLSGRINNSGPLVLVLGGALTMKEGSAITGNDNIGNGGGVRIENAVSSAAVFTMEGGSIHSNTANTGGGVYVTSGTFTMTGGTIYNNTATQNNGGGVYVARQNGGTFTKTGGTIYGSDSSGAPLAYSNKITGSPPEGYAVYVDPGGTVPFVLNSTADKTRNLDTNKNKDSGGGWDY